MHSHLVGRGGYQEKYAFLWRSTAVQYVDGAVVYLDVFEYPAWLTAITGEQWTHERARRHVSDHAPVYALLDGATLELTGM